MNPEEFEPNKRDVKPEERSAVAAESIMDLLDIIVNTGETDQKTEMGIHGMDSSTIKKDIIDKLEKLENELAELKKRIKEHYNASTLSLYAGVMLKLYLWKQYELKELRSLIVQIEKNSENT